MDTDRGSARTSSDNTNRSLYVNKQPTIVSADLCAGFPALKEEGASRFGGFKIAGAGALKCAALCAVFGTFCLSPVVAVSATYYASPNGTSSASCTSEDPGTIAAAIKKTAKQSSWAAGDTVVLLSGTYDYANASVDNVNLANLGRTSFVSVSTDKDYITIRSESGNPSDVILVGGLANSKTGRMLGFNCHARVVGVTISNCFANATSGVTGCGASVAASSAGLASVSNCVIISNSSRQNGGGLYCVDAYDSLIANNTANNGGGLFNGAVHGCIISNNSATATSTNTGGGGIYSNNGSISENSVFVGNTATTMGGGLLRITNGGIVRGCRFENNTAKQLGALGLAASVASNCVFVGNTATTTALVSQGVSAFYNCLFVRHTTTAAIPLFSGTVPNLYNCTIVDNVVGANNNMGGKYYNCILHGNKRGGTSSDLYNANASYCLYGKSDGSGTHTGCKQSDDPRFNLGAIPRLPDYALRRDSPAINAGGGTPVWSENSLDLAGKPRLNGAVDMGCYEYWPYIFGTHVIVQ